MEILICLFFGVGLILVGYIAREFSRNGESLWRYTQQETPQDFGPVIQNYPVALHAPEFGVIVDQAEWHPKRGRWLSVPYGDPVEPFAWYDLPAAPWPEGYRHIDTWA